MQFWTALQYPLCQAALVRDGAVVKTIPSRPPQTPARRVGLVGEYGGHLVIGRRNSIELWDREGTTLMRSVYHRWIYSLHDCRQLGEDLLLGCATLDVVFRLDWDGNVNWNWWAWREGLCGEPDFLEKADWQTVQLTQEVEHDTAHLNSIHVNGGGTVTATLLKRQMAVEVDFEESQPHVRAVHEIAGHHPHDFRIEHGRAIYGTSDGLQLGDQRFGGYQYVKRIRRVGGEQYLFTHEAGVTRIDCAGNVLEEWVLPRPFGFACLDLDS